MAAPTTQLAETHILDSSTLAGDPQALTVRTSADLTREYVAAGGWANIGAYARTLPPYVDDVSRDFGGVKLWRTMRHDPTIESSLSILIWALLNNGLHIAPGVDKPEDGSNDADYTQAAEIATFCNEVIANLEEPILQTLAEMALGIAYGYKVGELVYAPEVWQGQDRLVLKAIKCRPHEALAFVVDSFNNLLGLLAIQPGHLLPTLAQVNAGTGLTGSGPLEYPDLIPRRKFFIFSYRPENGDPRGISLLRPAYHPWWFKAQIYLAYMQYLARFGSPSVIVFTDPDAEPPETTDAEGNTIRDPRTAEEIALVQAQKIQNGAAGSFPGNSRVEMLESKNQGDPFLSAIHLANNEMTQTILGQILMTQESAHMARAAGEVHQDVFGIVVRHIKMLLAGAFRRDVILPLVEYNFGPEAARRLAPRVQLGATEHQDFAPYANAIAALMKAGFFDESQYQALDALLTLPPRDPASWQAKLARERAILEAAGAQVSGDVQTLDARLVAKGMSERTTSRQGGN